ncbi:MAG TPA: substrate-binding domain-containing protein [Longimicrobium sp.]
MRKWARRAAGRRARSRFAFALSHSRTFALLLLAACARADATPARELRVCADPNNLPFSNRAGQGFENRIAELVARDLGARVSYTWWPQRRGFFRETIRAGKCDVVIGVPASFELVEPTRPYYRSSYVFIARKDRGLHLRSFDDPRLKTLKIGVQIVGDDGFNTPPVHALARRGVVGNLRGYTLYGDYARPNPPAGIIDAVARGEVDVAIAWGPLAGYFAGREGVEMEIAPVEPQIDPPFLPFVWDISMGTRRGDTLRTRLDDVITRRRAEIDRILSEYGVPRVEGRRR